MLVIAAWQLNALALTFPCRARGAVFLLVHKRFICGHTWCLDFARDVTRAAWIAIAGSLDARMLILWRGRDALVGGFDVLYACQTSSTTSRGTLFRAKTFWHRAGAYHCRAMHVVMMRCWPGWRGVFICHGLPGWGSPWLARCSPTSIHWFRRMISAG